MAKVPPYVNVEKQSPVAKKYKTVVSISFAIVAVPMVMNFLGVVTNFVSDFNCYGSLLSSIFWEGGVIFSVFTFPIQIIANITLFVLQCSLLKKGMLKEKRRALWITISYGVLVLLHIFFMNYVLMHAF